MAVKMLPELLEEYPTAMDAMLSMEYFDTTHAARRRNILKDVMDLFGKRTVKRDLRYLLRHALLPSSLPSAYHMTSSAALLRSIRHCIELDLNWMLSCT